MRGRQIDYARISVTDRCNYRCVYCMPEEGVKSVSHGDILRYEEIIWLARILMSLGIRHIRFTGGEPLVRRGMAEFLVDFRREFPDIALSMTTNASLITGARAMITAARLSSLNISLDTLDPEKFASITRVGDIESVMSGISAALECGIGVVKTNTVLIRGFNDDELPRTLNFAWDKGMTPRIIEFMPLSEGLWGTDKFVGASEVLRIAGSLGNWAPVTTTGGSSRGPAAYYADAATGRSFGIIEAVSNHFCSSCNRLRITASGNMRACLFNNEEIPLMKLIRELDEDGVIRAVTAGINLKPEEWRGAADGAGVMSGIGG